MPQLAVYLVPVTVSRSQKKFQKSWNKERGDTMESLEFSTVVVCVGALSAKSDIQLHIERLHLLAKLCRKRTALPAQTYHRLKAIAWLSMQKNFPLHVNTQTTFGTITSSHKCETMSKQHERLMYWLPRQSSHLAQSATRT